MLPTLPLVIISNDFQVNTTSNCNYDYEMLYFDQMIEYTRQNICPETAKSEVSIVQTDGPTLVDAVKVNAPIIVKTLRTNLQE